MTDRLIVRRGCKQRLHVKILLKKFLNSIKLFLLFSTEISSTEYRDVAYVQGSPVLGDHNTGILVLCTILV
jgi:hypothetical protein